MKRLRLLLLLCIIAFGGLFSSSEAQISKIVGTGAACTDCTVFPLTVEVRCQAPEFCTRLMAPDWTNENRFYGTDGSNCRVSVDKGDTWNNCGANPSATTYLHYAVARDGAVLAAANDSGFLRIRRSIDGANSWTTVHNDTPVDGEAVTIKNGRLRCVREDDVCTFIYLSTAGPTEFVYLVSLDNGVTWSKTQTGILVSSVASGSMTIENNGIFGINNINTSAGLASNRAMLWDGGSFLWTVSNIWPTTAGGICNWSYILNSARRAICHDTTLGTTYNQRDENGIVLNTFTLPDVPSDNGGNQVGQAISVRPTGIWLLRTDTAGRTGIWVSLNSGISFTKLTQTDPVGQGIGTQGSIFEGMDGCIYTSYITTAATSTVLRIC